MGRLDGKVAVITGIDDIGKATATLFAKEGAAVVVNDIDPAAAKSVADQIQALGGKALALNCDVTKREDAQKLMDTTAQHFGKIDILVFNESDVVDAPLTQLSFEDFNRIIDLRNRSLFHCIQALAPYKLREELKDKATHSTGKIINLVSMAGLMGQPHRANFSAAEAGIIGATKQLAKEWSRYKVNVNAVVYGFVDGKLGRRKIPGDELGAPKISRSLLKVQVINLWNRPATPEEIAKPILFLASDEAEFITGEILNVTGGITTGY